MPACGTHSNWLRDYQPRDARTPDFAPVFSAWVAHIDHEGMSTQLRAAFTFLRRHGDGRYGAQSLMKLLTAADQLDNESFDVSQIPKVLMAEVPYSYDEETEVKSGGIVGVAVVLADGRLMMAVNRDTRRRHVGRALYVFATEYANAVPVVWVHQANITGAQFCLSMGLQPREVNSRGAVAWCARPIQHEDDGFAVECASDYELDEAVAMASHRRGASRPRRRTPRMTIDYQSPIEPLSRFDATVERLQAGVAADARCGDASCRECYPEVPEPDYDWSTLIDDEPRAVRY